MTAARPPMPAGGLANRRPAPTPRKITRGGVQEIPGQDFDELTAENHRTSAFGRPSRGRSRGHGPP